MLLPGNHLDNYLIIKQLGSGGASTIYLARDERLFRDVAIKILNQELAGDDEQKARFMREALTVWLSTAKRSHRTTT